MKTKVSTISQINKLHESLLENVNRSLAHLQLHKIYIVRAGYKKKEDFFIDLKMTYLGESCFIPSGIKLTDKEQFNKKNLTVDGNLNATLLLAELFRLVDEKFSILLKAGQQFTVHDIKNAVLGNDEKQEKVSILEALELFQKHIEMLNLSDKVCEATVRKNRVRYRRLREFIIESYGKKSKLDSLKPYAIEAFVLWLKVNRNYHQNSTQMLAGHFQRFANFCFSNGWLKNNPFIAYKKKFVPVDVKFLTDEEIELLRTTKIVNDALERQKDTFLFMYEVGISHADLLTHNRTHLQKSKTGKYYFVKCRTKTGIAQTTPLSERALQIIEKYISDPICIKNNQFVYVIDMMPMNRYLKQIAEICGINKPLSTKYARKSKITGMFENGKSLEEIQMVAGHRIGSDVTVRNYIGKAPDVLMNRFERLESINKL